MKLNDARARQLLAEMRGVIDLAREALRPDRPFQFSERITALPPLVEELQAYLPIRKREPVPFWKCVVKLDKEKPSLRLKKTLEALYARAARLEPGPLTRLMNNECDPRLSEAEKKLVSQLANHLERTPNEPPPEIDNYLPIFDRTSSKIGVALRQWCSRRARTDDRKALASLGFLDFYWQHRSWRDRYEQPIIHLYDIAVVLEHQPFVDKIKPLLFGDYIDIPRWQQSRWRFLAQRRQKKRRSLPNKSMLASQPSTKRRRKPSRQLRISPTFGESTTAKRDAP